MEKNKVVVESKPFSWNDKMADLAIEDFESVRDYLPYCQCQSIGLALTKLKMIEDKGIDSVPAYKYSDGYETKYFCPTCKKQQKNSYKNREKGCYCERCGQKLLPFKNAVERI